MKIDRKYLPSRNFLIALSTAILLVFMTLTITYQKKDVVLENKTLTSTTTQEAWVDNTDSDNDGLPDWKETLYKTNTNKADTDDDGTNDLQELTDGRDPLKANTSKTSEFNDMAVLVEQKKDMEDFINATSTNTDLFSLNLLSQITAYQNISNNGQLTEKQIEEIANNAVNKIDLSGDKYKGITTLDDLNFVEVSDKSVLDYIKFYYNETEKLKPLIGDDILLIKDNIIKEIPERTEEIKNKILQYKIIKNNFIKAPIPKGSSWGSMYHLMIINQLEKIILIDEDLLNIKNDPIKYTPAITAHSQTQLYLLSIFTKLDTMFSIKRPLSSN